MLKVTTYRLFSDQEILSELITSTMIRKNISDETDLMIGALGAKLWQSFINLAKFSTHYHLSTVIQP